MESVWGPLVGGGGNRKELTLGMQIAAGQSILVPGLRFNRASREMRPCWWSQQYSQRCILCYRQQEIEEKLIEEETARRVEELVAKRVEEELEKRKDEIEREVLRRVEEAKRIMEKQLLEELERQRQAELAAQKAREVTLGRLESRDSPWQNFQCWVCLLLSSERDGIQTNSFLI
ncbi:arglu1 protein [Lynx pardinus]|uniref:Arglu1 protein n=1 Tax=Lynx pardinus TaxID=191816 RepID=A0A485NMQ6_LYNPA|nr:arglu1 protein [Lynx pardinus]